MQYLTTAQFAAMMENIAPLEAASEWDNSGLLLDLQTLVRKVLVCLDVTETVLAEAKKGGFDTIVSHHPAVFAPMQKFALDDPAAKRLIGAVRAGVNLYAAHTSYDAAPGSGLSYALGRQIGLADLRPLHIEKQDAGGKIVAALGVLGRLAKPMDTAGFAAHLKKTLGTPVLRVAGGCGNIVKVACMGGAGGEFIKAAVMQGVDAYVVGEVKHHHWEEARSYGLALFEAGHYDTEAVFVREMCESLQRCANALKCDMEVYGSVTGARPYIYM